MNSRVTPLLPLALMAFLGAVTLWLHYAVLEGSGAEARAARHDADAIVENFIVQRLDVSGKLEYTVSAPKMIHFSDNGSGEVLYPRVVQIAADGGDLVATASRGTIDRGGEEAFLYGNVLILREATPKEPQLSVRTQFLHVLAEKGILRTDQSVTVSDGHSTVTGVGMVANKNKREFALQSQVRARYDAPPRK